MPRHPNKEIRAALEYAYSKGWRVEKAGKSSHAWGQMFCPSAQRGGCRESIWSTPKNPERHARYLRSAVDHCPHVRG